MGHSIFNATGGINSISGTEAITSTAHTYTLVNMSESTVYAVIQSDTETVFDPYYSVGQSGKDQFNIGGEWVEQVNSTSLHYKIPGGETAVFTAAAATDGHTGVLSFDTTLTKTSHGTSATNHQRLWLGQL